MRSREPTLALFLAVAVLLAVSTNMTDSLSDMLTAMHCGTIPEATEDVLLAQIKIRLYHGAGAHDFIGAPLQRLLLLANSSTFDRKRCSAVYFLGYLTKPESEIVRDVIRAYVKNGAFNFFVVDWSGAWELGYPRAVAVVPTVAEASAGALRGLLQGGARLCQLAGHGLAAHLAGSVARGLLPFRVPWILGLDPAGPLFYNKTSKCAAALRATDAGCVAVVHTGGGEYGAPYPTGDNDFYPVGGVSSQPGCQSADHGHQGPVCSHERALRLWLEALAAPETLVGRRCDSWVDFDAGICDSNPTQLLGQCSRTPGRFYLKTNSKSPYGQGNIGTYSWATGV